MILENYYEIVGALSKVEVKKDCLELTFNIEKTIQIPDIADIEKLKKLIGVQVGVLNCDGHIKIRKIGAFTVKGKNKHHEVGGKNDG